ncbi:MAG TPA: helix-turn-helix domain-containing protein [Terriglobales bacterium]|nr:helix-turn-helix domain-containing protein [Terriglobales bacterium]
MAGRDDARIFADACLWVQEAQTTSEVLRRANDGARLLVDTSCSYCAVRDGNVLRLVAHSGFRDPETARRWSLPVGKGIGGRVAERGETIVVRDYQHDPRRERYSKSLIDAEGLRCSIAVPIRSGSRVVGVLYAADHRLRRFTSDQVELMTLFARSVSAALAGVEERQALRGRLTAYDEEATRSEAGRLLFMEVGAALAGGGLDAALGVLYGRLGCAVELRSPSGRVVGQVGEPAGREAAFALRAGRLQLGTIVVWAASPLDGAARSSLDQVAQLVALWLLRERTALDDELGLGSRFLDDLLHGRLGDEDVVARQASILGVDLDVPRVVLCVGLVVDQPGAEATPLVSRQAAEVLRRLAEGRRLEPVLDLRGRDAVLLLRADGRSGPLRATVGAFLGAAGAALGGARLAGGLGRVCRALGDFSESYREAELALEVARASPDGQRLRSHEDLGFYGLVARAVEPAVLDALAERALEPLVRSDARTGAQYVRTLATFLRADRHLKPAAAALHLHVNTLRYRLGRIERLLGVDLDDVEARFQLEFAVKLLEARGRVASEPSARASS